MPTLYRPRIVTYRLANGSYYTATGKRVTKRTPGAVKEVTKAEHWVDEKAIEVGLKAGANARIILHAKKIDGVRAGDKAQARGTFRNYFMGSILIDCDQVKPVAR